MKLIMIPILFPLAYVIFANHNQIMDEYRAAYPGDPVKRAVIERCAMNRGFSRLDPDEREACYATAGLWPEVAVLTPRATPNYPYSPSQLPASDVRRQETDDTYCPAQQAASLPAPGQLAEQLPGQAAAQPAARRKAPPIRVR